MGAGQACLAKASAPSTKGDEKFTTCIRVYYPPMNGFPTWRSFWHLTGTASAARFDTVEEASAFNNQTAKTLHGGGIRH
jgi:hypothetical protein